MPFASNPNPSNINLDYNIGAPLSYQITFQQPASPIAEGIFTFHDDLILFLIGILGFVLIIILSIISIGKTGSNNIKLFSSIRVVHEAKLEVIWTCLPALFLVIIAIPSFSLLYSVDEIVEPWLIFKVIGHQWYWSYEFLTPKLFSKLYSDIKSSDSIDLSIEDNTSFDSYILALDDIPKKLTYINKLIVDNHLYLPTKVQLRAIITSTDVLHCWAVPSLGIKLDACPGRLNQIGLFINNQGFYYGQCSEICGVNHGFIPIGIVGVNFYIMNDQNKIDFDPLLSFFYSTQDEIAKPLVRTWGEAIITNLPKQRFAVTAVVIVGAIVYDFVKKVLNRPVTKDVINTDGTDSTNASGTGLDSAPIPTIPTIPTCEGSPFMRFLVTRGSGESGESTEPLLKLKDGSVGSSGGSSRESPKGSDILSEEALINRFRVAKDTDNKELYVKALFQGLRRAAHHSEVAAKLFTTLDKLNAEDQLIFIEVLDQTFIEVVVEVGKTF